jgi:Polyketide cyclase / dehydrase and lipid transport
MWSYEHSIETDATPEAIYSLYRDVPHWVRWDAGLELVTIDGPFVAGATGMLTPEGQGPLSYTIVDVQPDRGFSDETVVADVTIRFDHTLEPLSEGRTRVTHAVTISGPGADEFGPSIGPRIVADLPEAMEALARRALESSSQPVG